jgi:hypothetical protein
MNDNACLACKSTNVLKGKMSAFSRSGFVPDGGDYIPITHISGTACLDCGALILSLDTKELATAAKIEPK